MKTTILILSGLLIGSVVTNIWLTIILKPLVYEYNNFVESRVVFEYKITEIENFIQDAQIEIERRNILNEQERRYFENLDSLTKNYNIADLDNGLMNLGGK